MGQSFLGVNRSSRSLVQAHVPAIAGDSSMPAVTTLSMFLSGATGAAKATVSGLMEETPFSLYSVRPGGVAVNTTYSGVGRVAYQAAPLARVTRAAMAR